MTENPQIAMVRKQNDALRHVPANYVWTKQARMNSPQAIEQIEEIIRNYDAFLEGANGGLHDFGSFEYDCVTYFWFIPPLKHDESGSQVVIMLGHEWRWNEFSSRGV